MLEIVFSCSCLLRTKHKYQFCPKHFRPVIAISKLGAERKPVVKGSGIKIIGPEEVRFRKIDFVFIESYHDLIRHIPDTMPILVEGNWQRVNRYSKILTDNKHDMTSKAAVLNCTDIGDTTFYFESNMAIFNLFDIKMSFYPYRGNRSLLEQYVPAKILGSIENLLHIGPRSLLVADYCVRNKIDYIAVTDSPAMHNSLVRVDEYKPFLPMRGLNEKTSRS
jgi:hypothetical protein